MDPETYRNDKPFLLMEGGPLYRIEKRVGIIKANVPFTKRRALVAALITWVPLLLLAAIRGTAFGHQVPVPYLRDFSTYTRFLLAVPMLLLAENLLGPRIAEAAEHFITSGLVTSKDYARFDDAVNRGLRSRDSKVAEVVVALIAYITSTSGFISTAVHVSTWYAVRNEDGSATLTFAGWWLLLFCSPLFHFLVLRWVWRLFLWFQFLARMAKLDLQLFPTHPDQSGGLGFVGETQRFFGMLLFAYSVAIAGVLANDIVYDKVPLTHFAPAIGIYVVLSLLVLLLPLIVFSGQLIRTKRYGLHEYGTLATSYTGSFHKKWIEHDNPEHEQLLGTGDIQSLADLGNSYNIIERMYALPIEPRTLIHLALATLLPMTPLLLAVMPLKDVLKLLMKVIM